MTGESTPTPRWMKKLVRARMADTGEKYTAALRAVQADVDAARATYGTSR